MPLISGGYYYSTEAGKSVENLVNLTSQQIVGDGVRLDHQGCLVFSGLQEMESALERTEVLADHKSIISGRIFSRDNVNQEFIDIEKIKASQGAWLAKRCWGRYILVSFEDNQVTLYRDPQGLSTLFYMPVPGGVLFSSEIALLFDAVETKPRLNWSHLTSFVVNAHTITLSTPFEGISELAPGSSTCFTKNGAITTKLFWDPTTIESKPIDDEYAFEERLYDTFKGTTAAWSRGIEKICVELSGGLDSSSVLAVLQEPGRNLVAINLMHTDVASSNEIAYAKNVADLTNVPLIVKDMQEALPFAPFEVKRRFNKPSSFLSDAKFNQLFIAAAQLGKEDEIFGGQGGDHLFLAPPMVETVADYFLEKGFRGLSKKIVEIAAYHRMPYARVFTSMMKALGGYMVGRNAVFDLVQKEEPWMRDSFKSQVQQDQFKPLFWEQLMEVHPGKAYHIFAAYGASLYIDRGHRIEGKQVINPFLSQPLVELALSMPTYQSFAQGKNRVLFRRAMARRHQGDYIWRTSKGETSGILTLAVRQHFDRVCQLALEGRFAQEGLIDTQLFLELLQGMRHGKTDKLWFLMNMLVTELWFEQWGL